MLRVMTKGTAVDLLHDAKARLGEAPVWDAEAGCVWWIDCIGRRLHRYDLAAGTTASVEVGAAIHSIGLRDGGGLVAAMASGFGRLDPETGAFGLLSRPEAARPDFHFNDGKCGPDGCFWAGSMPRSYAGAGGRLFRLGPGAAAATMADGFTVPNGPGWSPDGTVFYIADSPAGAIFRYAFDAEGGALGPRQVAVEPGAAPGWPDGMAVDEDGCLWSARWDGGCVVRFTPQGAVDRIVDMPVSRPTSCAFAGPDLATLVVTSGTAGMDEAARAAEPLAGACSPSAPASKERRPGRSQGRGFLLQQSRGRFSIRRVSVRGGASRTARHCRGGFETLPYVLGAVPNRGSGPIERRLTAAAAASARSGGSVR